MEELIHSGLGIIDDVSIKKKIEECEKTASPFLISCFENDGSWGIWFKVGDSLLLINPIELVNSLFRDDEYWDFFLPYGEKDLGRFTFYIRQEKYYFTAELGHLAVPQASQNIYMFEEYVKKSQQSISDLLRVA